MKDKNERVKEEYNRLRKEFSDLPETILNINDGNLHRAADLKVRLEDISKDLDEKGYDEMFSQSESQEPYERERPSARRMVALDRNYHTIIKTLSDLKQRQLTDTPKEVDDGFESFVNNK